MEWVDGNIGSKINMKYPAVWLLGEQLNWLQGLGAVLVLAGVFLAKRQT